MLRSKLNLLFRKLSFKLNELKHLPIDFFNYYFNPLPVFKQQRIVFVGTIIHGRVARVAKWLKRLTKKKIIFICSANGYNSKLIDDSFDCVYTYDTVYELRRILKSLDAKNTIFHTFGPPYEAAYSVVKYIAKGKVLYDFQDLNITNYGLNPPSYSMKKELALEHNVLMRAKGFVCHSLELQSARKFYGIINSPALLFPNYTDNDYFVCKKNRELDLQNLHIVYVGGIMSSFRNKGHYGIMQLHWLIEKLQYQKIHFHVYPTPAQLREDSVDYVELDKKLSYFHLHESVSQSGLSEELSQYDFGILPFFHKSNSRLHDKQYYSTTLKMFNYFEASLPIITTEDTVFQNFIGRKFGGIIQFSLEDFDFFKNKLLDIDYKTLVDSIENRREQLSLKRQVHKLVSFYEVV